jgi:hypothetical protein
MGSISFPEKVKLFIGLIFNSKAKTEELKKILSEKFGLIDYESPTLPFNYTDYYYPEMGDNLSRQFISFKNLISPEKLAEIKIYTNNLEKEFANSTPKEMKLPEPKPGTSKRNPEWNRGINIDPGYLNSSKLVLASTKDFSHRLYLSQGIYAEVTLIYSKKTGFYGLDWTFPDYKSKEYRKIFNHLREMYREDIKES